MTYVPIRDSQKRVSAKIVDSQKHVSAISYTNIEGLSWDIGGIIPFQRPHNVSSHQTPLPHTPWPSRGGRGMLIWPNSTSCTMSIRFSVLVFDMKTFSRGRSFQCFSVVWSPFQGPSLSQWAEIYTAPIPTAISQNINSELSQINGNTLVAFPSLICSTHIK